MQPAPDSLILPTGDDPAEHAVARESVRLAFIAAATPRSPATSGAHPARRAAVASPPRSHRALDTSADAVNSTLRRARAAVATVERDATDRVPRRRSHLLNAYINVFEHHDVDALVAMLRRTPSSRCRRSNCGCKAPTTSDAGCSPLTLGQEVLTPVNAMARRPSPSTGRRRPEASPPVLDPGARQHRRAHRRHPRLPGPGAVRPVRPAPSAALSPDCNADTGARHRQGRRTRPARRGLRRRRGTAATIRTGSPRSAAEPTHPLCRGRPARATNIEVDDGRWPPPSRSTERHGLASSHIAIRRRHVPLSVSQSLATPPGIATCRAGARSRPVVDRGRPAAIRGQRAS